MGAILFPCFPIVAQKNTPTKRNERTYIYAADALNIIRFLSLTDSKILEDDTEFKIRIRFNEKEKTLEIEDNVGMSEKELQESIGTIAKSGTMQFLKNLKKDHLEQIGKIWSRILFGFYGDR